MNRIVGFDYLRVVTAVFVFLFHSWMHLGVSFGKLTFFISEGAIFMTLFFILSGYLLGMKYGHIQINTASLKSFYLRRLVSILPLYWFCAILYSFLWGKGSLTENILLIPIEFIGLQTLFSTIIEVSHNSGTWFISCLLFCYLFSPLSFAFFRDLTIKGKVFSIVCIICIY